jgi:lipopolysaccharide/colanic/teichoic acid biosynthesis glycosyltransferase
MYHTHSEERRGRPAVAVDNLRRRLVRQLLEWPGWSRRRTVVGTSLAGGDVAAAILATSIVDAVFAYGPFAAGAATIGALVIPLYLASSYAAGVYRGGGPSPVERVRARSLAVAWCAAAEIAMCIIASRLAVLDILYAAARAMILLVLGHLAESYVRGVLTRRGLWAAPALVVGSEANGARIRDMLVRHPGLGLRVVGVLPDALPSHDPISAATLPRSIEVAELGVRECEALVLSLPCDRPFARILEFERKAVRVVACGEKATPHDLILAQPPLDWFRDGCHQADRRSSVRSLMKRVFDLAVAVPAAILTLPMLAIVIAAVKWIDPGPALYIQQRPGRGGRPIPVYKIRSMYCDAEERLTEQLKQSPEQTTEWMRFFKLKQDPRILPWIGDFIRRTSLDELPQLWNIIRGDMSVVGPRPFPEYHLQRFDDEFRRVRSSVLPGLTGLWQVMARSDGDLAVQKTLDTCYVTNWSVWLELYILLETLPAVLSGRGAR